MALSDSNTFVEPTAATSISSSRSQFNNALRSLLTNFKSEVAPSQASGNITRSGAATAPEDGTLFFLSNTLVKALYIADSVNKKQAPPGGNFTRAGIGIRAENGIVPMMANLDHYEIGELASTVSAAGGLAANARVYLRSGNTNTNADFIDVGIPPTNGSVSNTMIQQHITADGAATVKTTGITGDRLNFAFDAAKGLAGQNAHIRVSAIAANPTAITLGSINVANTSIVHYGSTTTAKSAAGKDGLNILAQDGKTYGNVAARIISQAVIGNTPTDVSPLLPPGSIIMWSKDAAPDGWLLCDGSAVSRSTYAALFAIASTSFGAGDGSSTFNLPDFDDRLAGGKSSGISYTPTGGTIGSSSSLTTAATTPSFSVSGSGTASIGGKDTTGNISVIGGGSVGSHTHALTVPTQGVKFIIKT